MGDFIKDNFNKDGVDRRGFLKCMAWAGTGTLCVIQGGVLKSFALSDMANRALATATAEFDTLDQRLKSLRTDKIFYVPGEHDVLNDDGAQYRERYGKGSKGDGWYSFDQKGVHFIGLVNVMNLKAGGLGNLGKEQLEFVEDDVKHLKSSTPIVVFAHIPLWSVYPEWGWGTDDGAQALGYLKRFGSVSVLNGHIHQVMQKVEGNVTFHTAMSTAFPQPEP